MTTDRLGLMAAAMSAWVTDSYGSGVDPEVVLWRRVTKVCEESGEVWQALAGMVGANQRKGVTHTVDDVIEELLDVAFSALGAVEHLVGEDGQSGRLLEAKAAGVLNRVGLKAPEET